MRISACWHRLRRAKPRFPICRAVQQPPCLESLAGASDSILLHCSMYADGLHIGVETIHFILPRQYVHQFPLGPAVRLTKAQV